MAVDSWVLVVRILILTQKKLSNKDIKIIQNTDVFKIALNNHAQYLLPNARFTSDYIVEEIQRIDKLPVYSSRDKRGILVNVAHSGSSLVDCCKWLLGNEILLIADNKVHSKEFQNLIKTKLKGLENIYKFTKTGNFDLPYISLEDFINGNYKSM